MLELVLLNLPLPQLKFLQNTLTCFMLLTSTNETMRFCNGPDKNCTLCSYIIIVQTKPLHSSDRLTVLRTSVHALRVRDIRLQGSPTCKH
jgi:hypothetical protein